MSSSRDPMLADVVTMIDDRAPSTGPSFRCFERVADGWAWHATPNRSVRVLLAIGILLVGVPGLLLVIFSVLAMSDDQLQMRGFVIALGLGCAAVAGLAVASLVHRMMAWRGVVFGIDAASPEIRLSRGTRQRVVALGELRAVHVIHARGLTDTYVGLHVAGRWRSLIVGRRDFQPDVASDLRAMLPPTVDVRTPKWG